MKSDKIQIAGIGSSAGGLEALKQTLPALPDQENIVYVIVQHMDPKHDSLLTSILSTSTTMKVNEIKNGQPLVPNQIHITPPGFDVLLKSGKLILQKTEKHIGPKPSVDRFFTSLAEEQGERAIGIILSGTGSDGALGMRAIKASGGITIAQKPETSKYDGMPRSAIQTGSVDLIVGPESIGHELVSIIHSPLLKGGPEITKPAPDDMAQLMGLLKKHLGHDFSEYKENTIQRRINRRLAVHRLDSLKEYVAFAQKNPADLDGLVKDILISVTEFFRDTEAFEALRDAIEKIIESKKHEDPLRIWIPGCSSGEEVYSIAFLFSQLIEEKNKNLKLQLYATDIDGDMVTMARKGIYSEASLINVDQTLIKKYFNSDNGHFQVIKSIREKVVFAKQDIIHDPPFSHIDLITCRNLLIYFNPGLQNRIISMFHYALNPRGVLFLGKSESIGQHKDLFSPIDKKWRIFKRQDTGKTFPANFRKGHFLYTGFEKKDSRYNRKNETSDRDIVDKALSSAFGPPSALISDQMQLLYIKGDCQRYFEISEGRVGLSIFDLIKSELRTALRTTIGKAMREKSSVISKKNRFAISKEEFVYVGIHANTSAQIDIPEGYVLVSFEEEQIEKSPENVMDESFDYTDQRIVELEHELAAAHERIQTTVEELETSNEELQSLNEELQSANEELQSTNEELETSNEELQATNEELATVNEEMQIRSAELSEANADLENVFKRMGIPLMVLDTEMRIRRYTPATEHLFNIMPGDRGQLITNIGSQLTISGFKDLLEQVLHSGISVREIVQSTSRFYEMQIYPYYDDQNTINGLLISFYDITLTNQREQEFKALAENAPDIITRYDRKLRHVYLNRTIEKFTELKRDEFIGKTNCELGMPEELCKLWEQETEKVFNTGKENIFQFEFLAKNGRKFFDARAVPEYAPDGEIKTILMIARDITNLKLAQKEYEDTLKSISDGFFVLDRDLRVDYFNAAAGRLLNRKPEEVLGKKLFDTFPEAKGSVFEEKYNQVIKNRKNLAFETYFDQEPYSNWYTVSVYPRNDGISVYFQITTKQKTAQLETVRQKEMLQAVLDNIPVLITMYDPEVNLLLVNKEFETKTGWTKQDVKAIDIMERCYPDPEYREEALAYMNEASTDWKEFVIQTKAGEQLDTIWSNVNLKDGRRIGIGIDISEKRAMEKLLLRKAKLESLGTLAGGIAHDFNNCLASIIGFSEISLEKINENENCREDLYEVLQAGHRASDLVRQILTFSNNMPMKKEAVLVNKSVKEVVKMLTATIPSYITIELINIEKNTIINANASHIRQIIMNICTNSVHAMKNDGGILKIAIDKIQSDETNIEKFSHSASHDLLKIEISDTGTGIEQQSLDKLFDPYYSTKEIGEGSGLGLAVVHGIVESLNGEITVKSTLGKGSVFTVYLPLEKDLVTEETGEDPKPSGSKDLEQGTEHILILDDESAIVKMQELRLTRLGYKVTAFTDCEKALAVFRKNPQEFDLVVTDMTMPNMTGDRLAKAIKEENPNTPVILCTGHSEKILPLEGSDSCIDDILIKPIGYKKMAETVRNVLDEAKNG